MRFNIGRHIRRRWQASGTTARLRNQATARTIERDLRLFRDEFVGSYSGARRALTEMLRVIRANRHSQIQVVTLAKAVELCFEWCRQDPRARAAVEDWAKPIAADMSSGVGRQFASSLLEVVDHTAPLRQGCLFVGLEN